MTTKVKSGYKLELSNFRKYEEIPNDWNLKTLDDVGKIVGGGTPKTTIPEYWDGDILWATPTDLTKIEENSIDDTERKITQKGLDESSAKLIEPGNLIFSSRATVGECKINTKPIATNQGFQNIIPKKEHDKKFVFYTLLQNKIKFIRFAYGTTFLEIGKNNLKNVKIAFPDNKEEESKIANILSNLDLLLTSYRIIIKHNKLLKTGLMQKLLTKGIGHNKFKKVKWLFRTELEIPEDWDVKKIKNIAKISVGLVINPSTYFDKNGTVPMITGKNVTRRGLVLDDVDFISEKSNKLLDTTRIWSGDLVTMRVGYPGRTCMVTNEYDGINCASVIITRKDKKYVSQFLANLTNSRLISQQVLMYQAGGAQQVVNIGSWKEFLIPLPPIPEQEKIASILSKVDEQIFEIESKMISIKKIKNELQKKLLSGQIRVIA